MIRTVQVMCALLLLVPGALAQTQTAQVQTTQTRGGQAQGAPVTPTAKNKRLNATFVRVDAQGQVVLKYGSVLLTTQLAGIRLRAGSAGVLSLVLPAGAVVQAEVVGKGAVPSVVLWKGSKNLNEELLIQGVAEGIRK